MEIITLDTLVEDMLNKYPQAIEYGIMHGVRFMFCVGAYPTTIGNLLNAKNISNPQEFMDGLNNFLQTQEPDNQPPAS